MARNVKRQSMAEALGRSGEVAAFLREGDPDTHKQEISPSRETSMPTQRPVVNAGVIPVRASG